LCFAALVPNKPKPASVSRRWPVADISYLEFGIGWLQCIVAALAGSYSDSIIYLAQEYLAITYFAGECRILYGFDCVLDAVVRDYSFNAGLIEQVNRVFLAPVKLCAAALFPCTHHAHYREPMNPDFFQSILHCVQFAWSDYYLDSSHIDIS
jgi:hypothetical protein